MNASVNEHGRLSGGFTLIELMVTLAIAAILAATAMPALRNFIVGERIRTASFGLITHMTTARSEAIKRNASVTITSTSGTNAWAQGWTMANGGETIANQQAFPGITITASGATSQVIYNRNGRLSAPSALSFEVVDSNGQMATKTRCVTIGPTGQPSSRLGVC